MLITFQEDGTHFSSLYVVTTRTDDGSCNVKAIVSVEGITFYNGDDGKFYIKTRYGGACRRVISLSGGSGSITVIGENAPSGVTLTQITVDN